MKIVQSYWSKPQEKNVHRDHESRFRGGWLDKKFHYMSWVFSCLQLCRFYDRVELVTDAPGKELLVDRLGLPYTKVTVALEKIDHYDADLWALGKLYAYSIQDEPFLHVDGDVFIWKEFPQRLMESPLIAQHLEKEYDFYRSLMTKVIKHVPSLPVAIRSYLASGAPLCAYNMGIAGGHDVEFMRRYSREAMSFVDGNKTEVKNLPVGQFNTIYEQLLFFCLLHEQEKAIGLFSYTVGEDKVDEELKGFHNFRRAPAGVDLIHLYGNCKKEDRYCEELEQKLKKVYPGYYERVLDIASCEDKIISFHE